MMNPLTWAVSKVRQIIWGYQFDKTPVTRLGAMLVKDFKGALYCVGFDEVRLQTLKVLKELPRDSQYPAVLALVEMIEGGHD